MSFSWIEKISKLKPSRPLVAALLLLMPFALPAMTVVRQMDNALVDLRAKLAPRIASNRFVFAAIDKESLDHVGTWPWPRSVHAAIIDALVDAEARDILLDIDFSTASNPDEDQKLADALARAGGGVLLPVFEQHQRVGDPSTVSLTHPIDLLAANAWPAAVNVVLDQAGRFHGFAAGVALDGVSVPAASVQLAGGQDPGVPLLPVDFSIQPDTVTTISVADLLRGKVDADLLAGRSVVVGAYATELKDFFPVPVYGVLSGPMLNILGAETILQDRVPHRVPVWPYGVLLAVLILVGSQVLRLRRTVEAVALVVAVGASIEVTGYLLQKQWSMQLPSATCQFMLAAGIAILLFEKIGLAAWLLEVASAERRNSRRILKRVISDSTDPIIIVDGRGRILDLSRTAINLFEIPHGLRRGDDFGRWAPAPLTELVDRLRENLSLEEKLLPSVQEEITIHRSGQPLHLEATVTISRLEDGALHGAATFASCITLRDVTARKAYEAKLRRLAQLDDLTGALNRREFVARLAQSLGQGKVMAVGAIDLHRFGTLNSTFGRKAGDVVLSAVSRRLMSGAHRMSIHQEHAFVARLGGDVFCVAVALAEESHLESFPPTLLALLEKPVDARGIKLRLEARVGACIANSASDAGASVDAAEQALDEAKKIGGSGWRLHDPLAAVQQARRMRLEQEMRDALRANQFFLVYQPQVDLVSGAVCGAEALLRWKHPELGLVPPNDFIEVAESNGFICDLGRWALLEACVAAASWPSGLSVAVNVSAVQFAKSDLCADVRDALAASGLDPHRLHLEVTETAFLSDTERLLEQVVALRSLKIHIALDDFGTGYSSLGYIAKFPFDKIKIDQGFVRGIAGNVAHQAIVRSIQSLADSLGMTTVCEGIEEDAEWRMLSNFGCQQGQGYLFGKPQSAEDLLSLARLSVDGRATA